MFQYNTVLVFGLLISDIVQQCVTYDTTMSALFV